MKKGALILLLSCFTTAYAQLSVYNLAEYQLGNVPGQEPEDRSALYNQLNLMYRNSDLSAMARVEYYDANDPLDNGYVHLAQYKLHYTLKDFDFTAGHFFETLGRGMLLRSYEIKNALIEDQIDRIKHGFYRDIRGGKGSYTSKYLSVTALYGEMLNQIIPPQQDGRYADLISAGEVGTSLLGQQISVMYLENRNDVDTVSWSGLTFAGSASDYLSYYLEYTHQQNKQSVFDFGNESSYGMYASLAYSNEGIGVSLEYKNYHRMRIGSGINEPPTLVKEHSYRLLNRTTHIVDMYDESGVQMEVFAKVAGSNLLTINYSYGENELFGTYRYSEFFAEWARDYDAGHELKLFAQNSYDEILGDKNRIATGVYYSHFLETGWSVALETEYQQINPIWGNKLNDNAYLGISIARSTKMSASLQLEYTNDALYADKRNTTKVEKQRIYPGLSLQYKPNYKNNIILFAGERRGGPACTSGICYEVLDFKGVELRYTYRL